MNTPFRLEPLQELQLIHAAQRSDSQAAETLLEAHMPLVSMLARRFQGPPAWTEELIQAGCLGFILALQRYRDANQTRIMTYAVPWVLGEMKKLLRSMDTQGSMLSLDAGSEGTSGRMLEEAIGYEAIDLRCIDLRLAMKRLGEEEHRLLFLRFFRDKTQKETAVLLRKSQAQVSRIERRVLDKLHELLA